MTQLAQEKCKPCSGGVPPLKGDDLKELHKELTGWDVVDEHHLAKTIDTDDFATALDLVNRIGQIAEEQGHHPVITFTYGKVDLTVYTHKIDGLTRSDFILAAKIDRLWPGDSGEYR